MSCGLVIAIALLLGDPAVAVAAAQPPSATVPASVASEPLFADIIARSSGLKTMVDGWMTSGAADAEGFVTSPAFSGFKAQVVELAARDMQGHLVLNERGTDGDLKCILRGISEDMPKKLEAVETAATKADRDVALSELAYLLNDNVEVITSPPQPEV